MKIVFEEPVQPGFMIRVSGQPYTAFELFDYTTKLGAVIDMMRWTSLCWDCNRPFMCMAKPNEVPQTRRCEKCASPGKKVRKSKFFGGPTQPSPGRG